MDAKSRAHLTIDNSPQNKSRTFQISTAQIAQLRKALAQEHFFALGAEYGSQVVDGSTRTLSIQEGKRNKSITLYSLSDNVDKLSEVKRVLRIWKVEHSNTNVALADLEWGADPNTDTAQEEFSSIWQMLRERLLHRNHSDHSVNAKTTALLLSTVSAKENTHIVQALLAHGADPNVQGFAGFTPLCLTVSAHHPQSVRILLEHGA